jgi:hypothetical protein
VTGASYTLRDTTLAGFAVDVGRTGSKTFTLDDRLKGSRRKHRATFGRFPDVTPDTARREARAVKAAALLGQPMRANRAGIPSDEESAAPRAPGHGDRTPAHVSISTAHSCARSARSAYTPCVKKPPLVVLSSKKSKKWRYSRCERTRKNRPLY